MTEVMNDWCVGVMEWAFLLLFPLTILECVVIQWNWLAEEPRESTSHNAQLNNGDGGWLRCLKKCILDKLVEDRRLIASLCSEAIDCPANQWGWPLQSGLVCELPRGTWRAHMWTWSRRMDELDLSFALAKQMLFFSRKAITPLGIIRHQLNIRGMGKDKKWLTPTFQCTLEFFF